MDWYVVDKKYIKYLMQFDSQVGYVEYEERLKLHVGILLTNGYLYAVLSINNMIPVHDNCVTQLKYNEVENFRSFDSEKENILQNKAQKLYQKCIA